MHAATQMHLLQQFANRILDVRRSEWLAVVPSGSPSEIQDWRPALIEFLPACCQRRLRSEVGVILEQRVEDVVGDRHRGRGNRNACAQTLRLGDDIGDERTAS